MSLVPCFRNRCGLSKVSLFLICLGLPLVMGNSQQFGDHLFVAARATPMAMSDQGYHCYYLDISYSGPEKARIKLQVESSLNRFYYGLDQLTKEFDLAAGASVSLRLPVWSWMPRRGTLRVFVNDSLLPEALFLPGNPSSHFAPTLTILTTGNLDLDPFVQSLNKKKAPGKVAGELHRTYKKAESPLSDWASHWLDYSQFDAVWLAPEEWEQLTHPQKQAVETYVRCGGLLVIHGGGFSPPDSWQRRRSASEAFDEFFLDFGVVLHTEVNYRQWFQSHKTRLLEAFYVGERSWEQDRNYHHVLNVFPIVANLDTPKRGFFLLLLVFVLVIGPINIIVLNRRGKRIWLLWTVPLISVATSALVFGFAAVTEGFDIQSRRQGLTILDETTHMATTQGQGVLYAPLTYGGDLVFGSDTEVTPLIDHMQRWQSLDWSDGQRLRTGWLVARKPFYFRTRKRQLRRERLTTEVEDGVIQSVVNGFGVPIRSLYLTDGQGRLYSANHIQPGERAVVALQPGVKTGPETNDSLRRMMVNGWEWEDAFSRAEGKDGVFPQLNFNTYLAVLEGAPFVDDPLNRGPSKKDRSMVYGIRGGP